MGLLEAAVPENTRIDNLFELPSRFRLLFCFKVSVLQEGVLMVSTLIVVSVLSGTSIIAYLIWKKLIGSASVAKKIKDDSNDYSDISWNVSHVMTQEHIDLVESVERKNLLLFITIKVPYGTSAMLYRNADAWESYRHTAGALSMFECRSTRYLAVGSPSGTAELIGIFGVTETQYIFIFYFQLLILY